MSADGDGHATESLAHRPLELLVHVVDGEALQGLADRDEKGFVTVQDASRYVTDGVKLWASQRNVSQTPTLQYTVAGDIILVTV